MLERRRTRKTQEKITKPPRAVPILFSPTSVQSPHLLDLRPKLQPMTPVKPAWQPSTLDRVLSQPLKELKPAALTPSARPKPLVIEEGIFKISDFRFKILDSRIKEKKVAFRLPSFSFSLPSLRFFPAFRPLSFAIPAWQKALAGFVLFALLLTLPLPVFSAYYQLRGSQQKILASGQSAFGHLGAGQHALLAKDLTKASTEIQTALELFSQTQEEINQLNPLLRGLLAVTPFVRQKYLAGEHLTLAGANLSLAALPLLNLADFNPQEPLTAQLEKMARTLEQVLPKFQAIDQHLRAVDLSALPPEIQPAVSSGRQTLAALASDLAKTQTLLPFFQEILGAAAKKRYLLIFQNPNELRPTGGFIGSLALLDLDKGQIKALDIPGGGPYDFQGSLKAAVLPPAPLQLLKARWELQDANWFPDFPASAKKIAWFYEKGGGPSLDGVFALDTYLLLDLLKITGPLAMPEYGLIITADNFIFETQKQVEIDYDKKQNRPKQFLADLAPRLLERIFAANDWLALANVLNKNLNERHFQMYFNDARLEKTALDYGWAGELKENPNGDFLMVVNANIAGGKTDGVIKQTIRHQAKIEIDGSVVNKVTILREHQGQAGDLFTDLQNVDYLRLYVPGGSRLLAAEGFTYPEEKHFKVAEDWYKIDGDLAGIEQKQSIDESSGTVVTEEFNKTSFGNWVMTKPGQSTTVSFTYKLPFKILTADKDFSSYSLLVQKQAGRDADAFSSAVILPPNWQVIWSDPLEIAKQNNQLLYSANLEEDRYLGLVLQTEN